MLRSIAMAVGLVAAIPCLVAQDRPFLPTPQDGFPPLQNVAGSNDERGAVDSALDLLTQMRVECNHLSGVSKISSGDIALLRDLHNSRLITKSGFLGKDAGAADTVARTTHEAQAPDGSRVYTGAKGNGIGLNPDLFHLVGGEMCYGTARTARACRIQLAAILYGEVAHQNLRCRFGALSGNPKADPPGTPGQQTEPQNKENLRKSEVDAAQRAIDLLVYAIECFNSQLLPPLSAEELSDLQDTIKSLEGFKKANGG
ncbi:MAG: hypothetical protein IT456_11920 [Planctomycetes bacterium]|nr:hypothetical protein [Planctomycetota bacterium]